MERDSELIFGEAGGDVMMGMSVDIGVDAESDISDSPLGGSNLADDLQLLDRLDIEATDAQIDSLGDLLIGFADTGVSDIGGMESALDGMVDLTDAYRIDTETGGSDLL